MGDPSACWACLRLHAEFRSPFPPTCVPPVTLALRALLATLSSRPLSARTHITKPPQDQSVIKGTQASMVCGVTQDPRVTVRYCLCCDPMEVKGEGSFGDSWAGVDTKPQSWGGLPIERAQG